MTYCIQNVWKYGEEKMTITVDVDYKNIFDRKNSMEFKKYNIDEYFKEK